MTSLDRRLPPGFLAESLREDARGGLTSVPKSLPPKWFYDAQTWWTDAAGQFGLSLSVPV